MLKVRSNKKECPNCNKSFIHATSKYCEPNCYFSSMKGITKPSFWETASKQEQIDRLKQSYDKYVVRNDNGCWGWTGTPSKKYGSLQYGGKYKTVGIHVASWIIHFGEIPNGLWVLHKCDNSRCSNPEHLFLGSPTDNVKDMHQKGRNKTPRGSMTPGAKLKEFQIIEIRKLLKEMTLDNIAKKFNVDIITIFDIKHNKTWKHVKGDL